MFGVPREARAVRAIETVYVNFCGAAFASKSDGEMFSCVHVWISCSTSRRIWTSRANDTIRLQLTFPDHRKLCVFSFKLKHP